MIERNAPALTLEEQTVKAMKTGRKMPFVSTMATIPRTQAPDHAKAINRSAEITNRQWWIMNKPESAKIELRKILRKLTAKRIPFVLTGAHSVGGWTGDPRASHDMDFLVRIGRNHARAVKAIKELYPHLQVRVHSVVTAFVVPGEKHSAIDVFYPHRETSKKPLPATFGWRMRDSNTASRFWKLHWQTSMVRW